MNELLTTELICSVRQLDSN